MSTVQVGKTSEVYARVTLSTGDVYIVFPPTGKVSTDGMIDLLSAYSLKGKDVIIAYSETTKKKVGISLQSLVSVEGVTYAESKSDLLALSGRDYEDFPDVLAK